MSGPKGTPQADEASLVRVIREAIAEVAPNVGQLEEDTPLVGDGAVVDSVGFVTLLIAIETRMEGRVDLAASFLEHGAIQDDTNPFRTVETLARHIRAVMHHAGA